MKINGFHVTVLISMWRIDVMTVSTFFRLTPDSLSQLCSFVICLSLVYSKHCHVIVNVGSQKAEIESAVRVWPDIWSPFDMQPSLTNPETAPWLFLSHPPFNPSRYEVQITLSFSVQWQSGKGHAFRPFSFVQCCHSSQIYERRPPVLQISSDGPVTLKQ